MAKKMDHINPSIKEFIARQKMFFVGTADEDSKVNISPKGLDSLRILDPNRVVWLNVTGSGNETAAHILRKNRMTIMFCSFEEKPLILRLYGTAKIYHPEDEAWQELAPLFPALPGARQLFDVKVELVQTSCGFAVPFYDFKGDREQLNKWANHKGADGIDAYWQQKNTMSLDGKATDIAVK